MNAGRLEWIGRAPAKRAAIEALQAVELAAGAGLEGDHNAAAPVGERREVTLIQAEHLADFARILQRPVTPDLCRRNLVVSGLDLLSLRDRRFRVGAALLEGTGDCDPCRRMEENLGRGAMRAMLGRGGITARVVRAGRVRVGDAVEPESGQDGPEPQLKCSE